MTTQPRVRTGEEVEIVTPHNGVQAATVQAVVDGRVLLVFQRSIQTSNKGEVSGWQWVPVKRLTELAVTS